MTEPPGRPWTGVPDPLDRQMASQTDQGCCWAYSGGILPLLSRFVTRSRRSCGPAGFPGTPSPVPAAPYNGAMRCAWTAIALALALCPTATAQTPQPFPRPGQPAQTPTQPRPAEPPGALRPPAPAPTQAAPPPPARPPSAPAIPPSAAVAEPTAQSLGLPLYPAAQDPRHLRRRTRAEVRPLWDHCRIRRDRHLLPGAVDGGGRPGVS